MIRYHTGDIGINLLYGIIGDITMGPANHAWMVIEDGIYETEGKWFGGKGKSVFSPINKYNDIPHIVFRRVGVTDDMSKRLVEIANARLGTKYSTWDGFINLVTFPWTVFPGVKQWMLSHLNNPWMTKCDEEVMITWFFANKVPEFKDWGGYNPQTLLNMLLMSWKWYVVEKTYEEKEFSRIANLPV